MTISAVRGFNDILPEDTLLWRHIEESAWRILSAYGFTEIKVPIVERTELFKRSIGETTDIVEKEMYTFPDRRGDMLTLRPEGTAPVVRAYIQQGLHNTLPVSRLYYSGPMFRYERPQKGRYRQFHQIGAEVMGSPSPNIDGEVIEALMALFSDLKVESPTLHINSLGCPECRPHYKSTLTAFLESKRGELCEDCNRRIGSNPLRALDCKVPGCKEATEGAPSIVETLCLECDIHFEGVKEYLDGAGIGTNINPRMVRGLDYYSKTTFEITAEGLGSQDTVAAGGRYDSLVKDLGGPDTPCFGFAIGIERLCLILEGTLKGTLEDPLVYLIPLGDKEERRILKVASELRGKGIRSITDYGRGKLNSRMKRANKHKAALTIILGDEELAKGVAAVKNMATGEQELVPFETLSEFVSGITSPGE